MIKVNVAVYNKYGVEDHVIIEEWTDCFENGEDALKEMNAFFKTKWGGFKKYGWDWVASNDVHRFVARIWDAETKTLWNGGSK